MTDEQIASAILEICPDDIANQFCKDPDCGGEDCDIDTSKCQACVLEWLRE